MTPRLLWHFAQWRPVAVKAIPMAEREQDPATDTTSLPPLYPK